MTIDISAVREGYRRITKGDGHWFDRGTMRFFQSRLARRAYVGPGGVYFVSSEQYGDSTPRLYTVRRWNGDDIDTVGNFNAIRHVEDARDLAKTLANDVSA